MGDLTESFTNFLIINSFIIIPIYVIFIMTSLTFILNKSIKFLIDFDKILNKTKSLTLELDKMFKKIDEESYNYKKIFSEIRKDD